MEIDIEDQLDFSTILKQKPDKGLKTDLVSLPPTRKPSYLRHLESNLNINIVNADTSPTNIGRRKSRYQLLKEAEESQENVYEVVATDNDEEKEKDLASPTRNSYELRKRPVISSPRILNRESILVMESDDESVINIDSSIEVIEHKEFKDTCFRSKKVRKARSLDRIYTKKEYKKQSPEKPNYILKQLSSNLSPKFISPVSDKRLSLYFRLHDVTNSPVLEQQSSLTVNVKKEKNKEDKMEFSPKRNYQLTQLDTSLSPSFYQTDTSPNNDKRVSRYGRHQKQKDLPDFVPADVAKFITKNSPRKKKDTKNYTVESNLADKIDSPINVQDSQSKITNAITKLNDPTIPYIMTIAEESNLKDTLRILISPVNVSKNREINVKKDIATPEMTEKCTKIDIKTKYERNQEFNDKYIEIPIDNRHIKSPGKSRKSPRLATKTVEIYQNEKEMFASQNMCLLTQCSLPFDYKNTLRIEHSNLEICPLSEKNHDVNEDVETPEKDRSSLIECSSKSDQNTNEEVTSAKKVMQIDQNKKSKKNGIRIPLEINLETVKINVVDCQNVSPRKIELDQNNKEILSKKFEEISQIEENLQMEECIEKIETNNSEIEKLGTNTSDRSKEIGEIKPVVDRNVEKKETSLEKVEEIHEIVIKISLKDQEIKEMESSPENYNLTKKEIDFYNEIDDKFQTDYNDNNLDTKTNEISMIKDEGSIEDELKSNKARKLSDADSGKGSSLDIDGSTNYKVGQILWAYFSKQHWPCMVYPDPETNTVITHVTSRQKNLTKIHIVYFGCNGKRSWLFEQHLLPFVSLDNLKEYVMTNSFPKKYKQFLTNNVAKKKVDNFWTQSVQEAEEFIQYPILNRLDILAQKLEYERLNAPKKEKRKNNIGRDSFLHAKIKTEKRPRSISPESPPYEELVPLKKMKIEPLDNGIERFFNSLPTNLGSYNDSVNYVKNLVKDKDFFVNSVENYGRKSLRLKIKAIRPMIIKEEPTEVTIVEKKKKLRPSVKEAFTFKLEKNYLLKGAVKGHACRKCLKPGNTIKCTGKCYSFYHMNCVGKSDVNSKELKCQECENDMPLTCFVCNKTDEEGGKIMRCITSNCGYVFHIDCLRLFPQHKVLNQTLCCPYHTCHTCVSEDPRGKALDRLKNLVKCIKCPSAYHASENCIPAGSEIVSQYSVICTKHTPNNESNFNVNWCFICSKGGNLICCETCPTSFHLECLKFTPPPGNYYCEECETGRMPLYNEVVWCKFATFRWWPALTLPPPVVPDFMYSQQFVDKHEFVVKFFGTRDQSWIKRKRVFLYQDGDSRSGDRNLIKTLDKKFEGALEEAREMFEYLQTQKTERVMDYETNVPPPTYMKLTKNRYIAPLKQPVLNDDDDTECSCQPNDPDPCGPGSNCITRLTYFECNPESCPAKDQCQNQKFTKKEYYDLDCKRIAGKGWGLVTKNDISAGEFIVEYIGEVINNAELLRRTKEKEAQKDEHYYFLMLDGDTTIDAGPKGNLARFMNHSCDPNCETQKWDVRGARCIGLFAATDITAGTELTFNYNLECIGDSKKICHCNTSKCTGFIGEKFKDTSKDPKNSKDKLNKKKTSKKFNFKVTPLPSITQNGSYSGESTTNVKILKEKPENMEWSTK